MNQDNKDRFNQFIFNILIYKLKIRINIFSEKINPENKNYLQKLLNELFTKFNIIF
jgi:hypothetical protein